MLWSFSPSYHVSRVIATPFKSPMVASRCSQGPVGSLRSYYRVTTKTRAAASFCEDVCASSPPPPSPASASALVSCLFVVDNVHALLASSLPACLFFFSRRSFPPSPAPGGEKQTSRRGRDAARFFQEETEIRFQVTRAMQHLCGSTPLHLYISYTAVVFCPAPPARVKQERARTPAPASSRFAGRVVHIFFVIVRVAWCACRHHSEAHACFGHTGHGATAV